MLTLCLRRNTAVIKGIFWLVDISPTRAVNMGGLFTLPVFTGRVEKKHCKTTMLFLNTARVHGPWTRVGKNATVHGPRTRAVNAAREHG